MLAVKNLVDFGYQFRLFERTAQDSKATDGIIAIAKVTYGKNDSLNYGKFCHQKKYVPSQLIPV